jgi:hypothetical protein
VVTNALYQAKALLIVINGYATGDHLDEGEKVNDDTLFRALNHVGKLLTSACDVIDKVPDLETDFMERLRDSLSVLTVIQRSFLKPASSMSGETTAIFQDETIYNSIWSLEESVSSLCDEFTAAESACIPGDR